MATRVNARSGHIRTRVATGGDRSDVSTLFSPNDEVSAGPWPLDDEIAEHDDLEYGNWQQPDAAFDGATHEDNAICASLEKLEGNIEAFDQELQNFFTRVTPLGACVGMLSSSFRLRERLAVLRHIMRYNAAQLCHSSRRELLYDDNDVHSAKLHNVRLPYNVSLELLVLEDADKGIRQKHLPHQLELLAEDISLFFDRVHEFPEFADQAVEDAVAYAYQDFRFWANFLEQFDDKPSSVAVASYIHSLAPGMGSHMATLQRALRASARNGIPTLLYVQEQDVAHLANLSTVATFFSAVTATTIQFSYQSHGSNIDKLVNSCWYISLVLSITSAIHSVLAVTWEQAVYRSPDRRAPWWILIWIRSAPLVFLTFSVMLFCIGLVFFIHDSGQDNLVTGVVGSVTAACFLGFVSIALWFFLETAAFYQSKGRKWTTDIFKQFGILGIVTLLWRFPRRIASKHFLRAYITSQLELSDMPPILEDHRNLRFRAVVNAVRDDLRRRRQPQRSPTRPTFPWNLQSGSQSQIPRSGGLSAPIRRSELLRQLANNIQPSELTQVELSPVRHLSFSPDGRFLSTCGWGPSSTIVELRSPDDARTLEGASTSYVRQVLWSPRGDILVTRRRYRLDKWQAKDGTYISSYPSRSRGVHSSRTEKPPLTCLAWFPDGEALFIAEERGRYLKHSISDNKSTPYTIGKLPTVSTLHAVAITSDSLAIAFATTPVPDTLGGREEYRLLAINLHDQYVETCVPILHSIVDISLSRDSRLALINFDVKTAPQLWHIGKRDGITRLTLLRSFLLDHPAEWQCPCTLAGQQDEFVIGVSKEGDIYMWERETGLLLRRILAGNKDDGPTCIAYNGAAEGLSFATGSHTGKVRLWQARD